MKNVKLKRILVALAVGVLITTASVSASANCTDEVAVWSYRQTKDGTTLSTRTRAKEDYSSSYAYNYCDSAGTLGAWVNKPNSPTPDRYYGGVYKYNGPRNRKALYRGQSAYLPNYIREDGYTASAVGVINSSYGMHNIAWSPDSV